MAWLTAAVLFFSTLSFCARWLLVRSQTTQNAGNGEHADPSEAKAVLLEHLQGHPLEEQVSQPIADNWASMPLEWQERLAQLRQVPPTADVEILTRIRGRLITCSTPSRVPDLPRITPPRPR